MDWLIGSATDAPSISCSSSFLMLRLRMFGAILSGVDVLVDLTSRVRHNIINYHKAALTNKIIVL